MPHLGPDIQASGPNPHQRLTARRVETLAEPAFRTGTLCLEVF